MHLSTTELARLELMFTSGQVRSDPPILSPTDRMMDAMIAAAKMKAGARTQRRAPAANPSNAAVAADAPGALRPPRTLTELIEIRRALLRNEQPRL